MNRLDPNTPFSAPSLFVLTFRPGPGWKAGLPMKAQGLAAHLERLRLAASAGSVLVAGPYADGSGGIALVSAADEREARAFVAEDPAVIDGTMVCSLERVLPMVGAEGGDASDSAAASEAVVRRLFEAVPRRDLTAADAYANDVVLHEAASLPYGGDYVGAEGALRHATNYLRHWDGLQTPEERQLDPMYFCAADHVLVLWRQRGHRDDVRFDMPAVSAYRLAEGRIVDSRMFHFDAAAVADFLSAADDDRGVAARDAALNRTLEEGRFADALREFFADEAEMAEVDQPPTVGKAANAVRERIFLGVLERIDATLLSSAIQGDVSFSEWQYEIAFKSGRTLSYRQTARRRWRRGQVVREDFFHADFPAWFAGEIEAALQRAQAARR